MLPLRLGLDREPLRVLCLGAHADDIEIGCAGTLLRWLAEYPAVDVTWAVFIGTGARGEESRTSATALLREAASWRVVLGDFEDAHLPGEFARAKAFTQGLRSDHGVPHVVFTHRLEDAHQDHRLVAELTWQTWRDQLILEYEIPKYEGDLGRPNLYAPLPAPVAERKIEHLLEHFGSQRSKEWFRAETFSGLMRLRGVECRAESGFAEGFHLRKARM
jgi:LmbE family N-acetylglucosaminyl deacetylase